MKSYLRAILVVMILIIGFFAYTYLIRTKPVPKRIPAEERATAVEVISAEPGSEHVIVSAMGLVMAAKSITVLPEVHGRIVVQNSKLIPGGSFKAGELLVKLDPRDYELAVKQQSARVVQAEAELAKERGLKAVAEREWSLIQDEVKPTEEGRKLALREIQLENSQAMLASAQSALEQAKLQLSRTMIRAPFDCLVIEEYVDPGQVVSSATKIATLVASDKFWVRTSVPLDSLGWISIPGINSESGSEVKVIQKTHRSQNSEWKGRIIKLLGNLDPRGKMARLLVEVDQPLGVTNREKKFMPLLLDAFVNVYIQGLRVDNVYALPRRALRDKDRIWVMTENSRLEIRPVEAIWTYQDKVYIQGELKPTERVIVSSIKAPVHNMLVVTGSDEPQNSPASPKPTEQPANISQKMSKKPENQL